MEPNIPTDSAPGAPASAAPTAPAAPTAGAPAPVTPAPAAPTPVAPAAEPVATPIPEAPAPEPVVEPASEPIVEPKSEPATEPTPEPVVEPEEEEKPKKHLSKNARIAIIISSILLALIGIAALLYFVIFKKEEPVIVLTDRDILVSRSWEKQGAPTVIWTFHADGTGELTTNKTNYYDTKWTLSDDEESAKLEITTAWLYELKDSFTFALDREANTFTVKNLSDDTESVFVPLGTAETAAEEAQEEPATLEKSE